MPELFHLDIPIFGSDIKVLKSEELALLTDNELDDIFNAFNELCRLDLVDLNNSFMIPGQIIIGNEGFVSATIEALKNFFIRIGRILYNLFDVYLIRNLRYLRKIKQLKASTLLRIGSVDKDTFEKKKIVGYRYFDYRALIGNAENLNNRINGISDINTYVPGSMDEALKGIGYEFQGNTLMKNNETYLKRSGTMLSHYWTPDRVTEFTTRVIDLLENTRGVKKLMGLTNDVIRKATYLLKDMDADIKNNNAIENLKQQKTVMQELHKVLEVNYTINGDLANQFIYMVNSLGL